MELYAHPFSSYCQKALIAFYENDTPFEYRMLSPDHIEESTAHAAHWPLKKFPLLVDDGRRVMEASIIVEYLDLHHPGPIRLVPEDPRQALDVRLMDRIFDNYVMTPMQRIVGDSLRNPDAHDPVGIAEARQLLDQAYGWLNQTLASHAWACGDSFSLADCAAAPALFYADWVHPIADAFDVLRAYRGKLLQRPSFARAVDEARPYRSFFPPGAPDRD